MCKSKQWCLRQEEQSCGLSYGELAEDAVTGKIAIQKDLSDDVMVYALYSTGNKPGGNSPNEFGDTIPITQLIVQILNLV